MTHPFISVFEASQDLAGGSLENFSAWLRIILDASARGELALTRSSAGGPLPGGVQPYGHDANSLVHVVDLRRWADVRGYARPIARDGGRDDLIARWEAAKGDVAAKGALAEELLRAFGTREAAAAALRISRQAFSHALKKGYMACAPTWPAGIEKFRR